MKQSEFFDMFVFKILFYDLVMLYEVRSLIKSYEFCEIFSNGEKKKDLN